MQGLTLSGRVALVTGGAGGIGAAIARDLADIGARVVICDLNEAAAKAVASDLPDGVALPVDLSQPDSIEEFAVRLLGDVGKVDVLVNNAGWDKVGPFLQSDPGVWDRLLGINLRAPIQLAHRLLPAMVEQGWGRLLHIASDAGRVGSTGEAVYSACKGGLIAFSKTVAREVARHGVTSNVVCPGPSDTPLFAEVAGGNPKLVESLKRAIPIGRIGRPDDVSGLVAYLCSERAEFITGQTMSVSGGLTMV